MLSTYFRLCLGLGIALTAIALASLLVDATMTPMEKADVEIGAETVVAPTVNIWNRSVGNQTEPAFSEIPAPLVVTASPIFKPIPNGHFTVQLGSYRNLAIAEAERAWKQSSLADRIDGGVVEISPDKSSGGSNVRYKLIVSGIASRGRATKVCAMVRRRGSACVVTGPPASPVTFTVTLPASVYEAQPIDPRSALVAPHETNEPSSFCQSALTPVTAEIGWRCDRFLKR